MRGYFWKSVFDFKTRRGWHALFLVSCVLFLLSALAGAIYRLTQSGDPVMVHFSALGNAFAAQGQVSDALESYSELLEIRPNPDIEFNMANTLAAAGKPAEAEQHYRRALKLSPAFPEAHYNLANLLAGLGNHEAAFEHYRLATVVQPDYVDAFYNWGVWMFRAGRLSEAAAQLDKTLELQPVHPEASLTLGLIRLQERRYSDARSILEEGLKKSPSHVSLSDTLAWTLATAPEKELRDGRRAVELAEQVCAASEKKNPQHLDTLAAAYAESGRFDEAARTADQAVALARQLGNESLAVAVEQRLALYSQNQPYREGF